MTAKDHRLNQNISELMLSYVTTLALCNRMVQCGIAFGYAFPTSASRLKQVASGIQLPTVLCQYVESVGRVTLSSGLSVVPHVADYNILFPEGSDLQLDPFLLLGDDALHPRPADWPINVDVVANYNDATTRASRSGMKFRAVNNTDLTGKVEMVVSFTRIGQSMLLPKAPQVMTEAEAQLGACYRFRDYSQLQDWPGENKELLFDGFTAIPFEPRVVFSDVCVAAFKGSHISTE